MRYTDIILIKVRQRVKSLRGLMIGIQASLLAGEKVDVIQAARTIHAGARMTGVDADTIAGSSGHITQEAGTVEGAMIGVRLGAPVVDATEHGADTNGRLP